MSSSGAKMTSTTGSILQPKQDKKISNSSELYKLPKAQYAVMTYLLDVKERSYRDLCEYLKASSQDKTMLQSDIDSALYELIRLGYLTSYMENGDIIYMSLINKADERPQKRDEQNIFRKLSITDILDSIDIDPPPKSDN